MATIDFIATLHERLGLERTGRVIYKRETWFVLPRKDEHYQFDGADPVKVDDVIHRRADNSLPNHIELVFVADRTIWNELDGRKGWSTTKAGALAHGKSS